MNNIKKFLLLTPLFFILNFFLLVAPVSAQLFQGARDDACAAVGATKNNKCDEAKLKNSSQSLNSTVKNVINLMSIIVGVASVVMIIVGGFRYVTSNGDSNQITSAKHTLLYALVGLLIVSVAQAIVKFVLGKL